MTYVDQQQRDSDEVLTSAPPLPAFDPEKTWTGDEEQSELDGLRRRNAFLERQVENLREQLSIERSKKVRVAAAELRADEAERRATACANVILRGLSGLTDEQVAEEFVRRFNPERVELLGTAGLGCATIEFRRWVAWDLEAGVECASAAEAIVRAKGFAGYVTGDTSIVVDVLPADRRPIPTSTVPVARDDAGDHALQDVSQRLG
jgi:hypothetical protein